MPAWIKEVRDLKGEEVVLIIAGNKADLLPTGSEAIVEQAKKLAEENKATYFEVSAKSGKGINEMFNQIAIMLTGESSAAKDLQQTPQQEMVPGKEPDTAGIILSSSDKKAEDLAGIININQACCR